ncbi:MAG: hypothetical protein EXR72_04905 [Myxococcales bacterium]|nr:hypothetical protein [Myxococcales bacterium]
MKYAAAVLALTLATPALLPQALAKGPMPEDLLKGRIIISDRRLPTSWSSVPSYVAQLKNLNKTTLWYDKKTNKLKIEYAAFFSKPINDVQVDLVIYDITNGANARKAATEQFMNRGDRALFNSVTFDNEDFEMNKKYRLVIESRHAVLASGEFILRGEGPHYSGKVTFSEDETKVGH